MTGLGDRQQRCLKLLAFGVQGAYGLTGGSPAAYPGGGWIWDNHHQTVLILDSLVRRGLAERTERPGKDLYEVTDAGLIVAEQLRSGKAS